MKTPIIPFLYCGLVAFGFSSCGKKEEELGKKESELKNQIEIKRKELNSLVRKVDELETADHSENLIDAELELESLTRQIEFEKSEQASLAEEEKGFKDKLADYQKKYPFGN